MFTLVIYGPHVPVRTVIALSHHCDEMTSQKEVYENLADGTAVVYVKTCTVCNKDL